MTIKACPCCSYIGEPTEDGKCPRDNRYTMLTVKELRACADFLALDGYDGHARQLRAVARVLDEEEKTVDEVRERLRQAWNRDTSADPANWTPDNPAWGQCAVTALIVQDEIGGELWRCKVGSESHYYNVLRGREIDLTWEQFGPGAERTDAEPRSRAYVLSFPDTVRRYQLLRQRAGRA